VKQMNAKNLAGSGKGQPKGKSSTPTSAYTPTRRSTIMPHILARPRLRLHPAHLLFCWPLAMNTKRIAILALMGGVEDAIENTFSEMEENGELDGEHNAAAEAVHEGSPLGHKCKNISYITHVCTFNRLND
jgi:hypothetical protein